MTTPLSIRLSTRSTAIRHSSPLCSSSYPKTFDKILVANRGEIACRIILTAKKMGIRTVAVFSEPDHASLHVKLADEAVNIGPAPSSKSYLSIPNMIAAIKSSGAQAVHPGYGFLSENSAFAKALHSEGIPFIGPSAQSMLLLGDKIESKRIAADALVNTIPGFVGQVKNVEHALDIAKRIGYPLIIKASAGGGGKGMRVVFSDQNVLDYFDLVQSESMAFFGDNRLLIERYIEDSQHIEIQLLGDHFGNVVWFPERQCSIQRRYQKIIEETPSIHLDPSLRAAMGNQAVSLAKKVGYFSAGTAEFLVDSLHNFYFLEMNARLQVEHGITELVTGYDLVEQMIRVAARLPITMSQEDIKIHGHAIESRIFAEDPKTFLPSVGTLTNYIEPTTRTVVSTDLNVCEDESRGLVRCDSGVEDGSTISIHYDPLISKTLTWAPTRNGAIQIMKRALDAYVMNGIVNNIPLLCDIIDHPRFKKGDVTSSFFTDEYPSGFSGMHLKGESLDAFIGTAACVAASSATRNSSFLNYTTPSSTNALVTSFTFILRIQPSRHKQLNGPSQIQRTVMVRRVCQTNQWEVCIDKTGSPNQWVSIIMDWVPGTPFVTTQAGTQTKCVMQYLGPVIHGFKLQFRGTAFDVAVLTPVQAQLMKWIKPRIEPDASLLLLAPMPGQVVQVSVLDKQNVGAGHPLLVLEAMKLQNVLRAPRDLVIRKVLVAPGQSVAADEILAEFEP